VRLYCANLPQFLGRNVCRTCSIRNGKQHQYTNSNGCCSSRASLIRGGPGPPDPFQPSRGLEDGRAFCSAHHEMQLALLVSPIVSWPSPSVVASSHSYALDSTTPQAPARNKMEVQPREHACVCAAPSHPGGGDFGSSISFEMRRKQACLVACPHV
jgi:hypothetical protein